MAMVHKADEYSIHFESFADCVLIKAIPGAEQRMKKNASTAYAIHEKPAYHDAAMLKPSVMRSVKIQYHAALRGPYKAE
jgi:hypothetical protein